MPTIVLLDTNVWVSAFINPSGTPAQLRQAWHDGKYDVMVSPPLLGELADVLSRPQITKRYPINVADVEELLDLLTQRGIFVSPTGAVKECRDPDDDLILETAILGKAQYAVTRDEDLINRLKTHDIVVLSVQQFKEKLDKDEL